MQPKIRNILFAAGLGHDTGFVLAYALDLARKYNARIHIIHSHEALNITDESLAEIFMEQEGLEEVFNRPPLDTEEKVTAYLEEICRAEVEKLSVAPEVIASIQVSRYAPKAAILKAVQEVDADLIVMGSHRHLAVNDALLGSTTMKVLHSARVPVLVVRIPEQIPAD